jgi:hypothetical protein
MRIYDPNDPASVEAFERGEPVFFVAEGTLPADSNSVTFTWPEEGPEGWEDVGYTTDEESL